MSFSITRSKTRSCLVLSRQNNFVLHPIRFISTLLHQLSIMVSILTKKIDFNINNIRDISPWNKFMWKRYIPPSRSIVGWRAFLGCLPIQERLLRKCFSFPSRCLLCKDSAETLDHLLITCRVPKQV